MTNLTDAMPVIVDHGGYDTNQTTLGEFFAVNPDSLQAEDREAITAALAAGKVYRGGGGAEAEWSVRRAA